MFVLFINRIKRQLESGISMYEWKFTLDRYGIKISLRLRRSLLSSIVLISVPQDPPDAAENVQMTCSLKEKI